jgi:methylase of polypeptide subunit release factors
MKLYSAAPLPFQGQKRRHVQEFSKIISQINPPLIVDLFGGSGLLSHVAKQTCPKARVIYNDYDNFCERLAHVKQTNEQLRHLRNLLQEYPRNSRITGKLRETILQYLKKENQRGYVDWITLSASLLFSMKYKKSFLGFQKNSMYNCVRRDDYATDGYLTGLEVVRTDYSKLCTQYRSTPHALFVADPPYLSTDTSTYSSADYWRLKDYLNVLTALSGLNYVYFTSDKSQIVELCEWLEGSAGKVRNIFRDASIKTVHSPINYHAGYTDIMLYKLNLKNG